MGTAAEAVAYARSFVGKIHEVPPGSNHMIIGQRYGLDGVAYCAEGIVLVLEHDGVAVEKTPSAHLLIASGQDPHFGSLVTRFADLEPGDVAGWNYDPAPNIIPNIHHASMIGDKPSGGYVRQIGFNTSPPSGGGSEWNGDGCWEKSYPESIFCVALRPHYDGGHKGDNGHPRARFEFGKGDKGSDVRLWQQLLNRVEHMHLKVDGQFGPATEAATKQWQKKHNLKVDGTVFAHTIHDLSKVAQSKEGK